MFPLQVELNVRIIIKLPWTLSVVLLALSSDRDYLCLRGRLNRILPIFVPDDGSISSFRSAV
jgi:hypothetical protein